MGFDYFKIISMNSHCYANQVWLNSDANQRALAFIQVDEKNIIVVEKRNKQLKSKYSQ